MKVLQVCAYAAPYEGNFMNSLYALENRLKQQNIEMIYAFPETAKNIQWCIDLSKRSKVYFLPLAKAQINPKTYHRLKKIYKENPDIEVVHSHFEHYDTPVTLSAPKKVKVFWHLHDPVTYSKTIKGFLMKFRYKHISKRAFLISVAEKYRLDMVALGLRADRSVTVLNGIFLDRIDTNHDDFIDKEYDFITFGWDFFRKGDDIILNACDKLSKKGYSFKFLLNGGDPTWKCLDEYYNHNVPDYVVRGMPESDINKIFQKTNLFIQASRRETFSYSIAEAAYAGLSVVSSDIPGVEWAHDLPTVEFFQTEDAEKLCDIIENYLKGKTATKQDVEKTREIISEKYSVKCWVDKIIDCYGIE